MATEILISDAVVAELNDTARAWVNEFTATREWAKYYTPEDLATLQVKVSALRIVEEKRISRGDTNAMESFEYEAAIDFQMMLPLVIDEAADRATVDGLTEIAEQVHDFFRDGHRLATMTSALVQEALRPDLFDEELLYHHRTWETTIFLTVFITR